MGDQHNKVCCVPADPNQLAGWSEECVPLERKLDRYQAMQAIYFVFKRHIGGTDITKHK